jgi:hypothetical protein
VPLHKDDSFGVRGMEFRGQELLEVSAVTVPSNPDALQRLMGSSNLQPALREIAEERLIVEEDDEQEIEEAKAEEDEELLSDLMAVVGELKRMIELLEERAGESPDEDEPTEDDDEADTDDYGDGDEPESRDISTTNEGEYDLYAEVAGATAAALEEAE